MTVRNRISQAGRAKINAARARGWSVYRIGRGYFALAPNGQAIGPFTTATVAWIDVSAKVHAGLW